MKISEIDAQLKLLTIEELKVQLVGLAKDERAGVQKLIVKYQNKVINYETKMVEWQKKCAFDQIYHQDQLILAGVDEVGRGPLAGPVVAAAVILPYHSSLLGLKDSKQMSEAARETLYAQIKEQALAIGVGCVSAAAIDRINILNATFEAMRKALENLKMTYDMLLVDGNKKIPNVETAQYAIIAGDDKSAAVAAASVIAKVTRDRMMQEYAKQHPGYDWQSNKGYGSVKHYEGIKKLGITQLHRKSFLKNEGIF